MDFLLWPAQPAAGLAGLFVSSFLAATLLPGGSEIVLVALLRAHPEQMLPALLLATLGNTLGGLTTYGMARLLPERLRGHPTSVHLAQARRWGPPVLILAWAPVIGDALCAAAGWLRLPLVASAFWMALGKGMRYLLLAWGASVW